MERVGFEAAWDCHIYSHRLYCEACYECFISEYLSSVLRRIKTYTQDHPNNVTLLMSRKHKNYYTCFIFAWTVLLTERADCGTSSNLLAIGNLCQL